MKTIKAISAVALAAVVMAGCGAKQDDVSGLRAKGSMTMITEATFPPYEFLRGDEIVGIDIEICQAIADKVGVKLLKENAEFDSVLPALISGKADLAAAGITVTEDRKAMVDFTIPYVTSGILIISKVADPVKDVAGIAGKRVGVQAGTTSDTFCVDQLKIEPERFDSPATAVAALKAGKCDLVIADIDPAKNCVKGETEIAITSDLITHEDFAVAIRKGQPELLKVANEVIAELKESGKLAKWIEDYTKESDSLKEGSTAPAAVAAVEAVAEKAEEAVAAVEAVAEKAEEAEDAVEAVAEKVEEAAPAATEAVEAVAEEAKNAVEAAVEKADEAVANVAEKADAVVEAAVEKTEAAVEAVAEKVNAALETVAEKTEAVAEKADAAVKAVTEKAEEAAPAAEAPAAEATAE